MYCFYSLRHCDTETIWSEWKAEFLRISNKHAPIKVAMVKNRYNPWMNPDIINLMYKRDLIHNKQGSRIVPHYGRSIDFWAIRWLVVSMTQRKHILMKCLINIKIIQKHYGKNSVELSGTRKKDNTVPQTITSDMFNECFSNIGSDLIKSMPDPGNLSWKKPECRYSFSFEPIRESCVENIMKSLLLDSNLDVLDIDSKLLRIAAELLTPSVTRILNHSLISGVVPQDWKIARVTPLYKEKGDKNDRSNCRPISVLGSISMIIEREVHSQILSYFIKHDLITIDQFAFLKNHSTTGCLHRIIDDWYEALNEGEFIRACFFLHQKVLWLHQSCNTPAKVSSTWHTWSRVAMFPKLSKWSQAISVVQRH